MSKCIYIVGEPDKRCGRPCDDDTWCPEHVPVRTTNDRLCDRCYKPIGSSEYARYLKNLSEEPFRFCGAFCFNAWPTEGSKSRDTRPGTYDQTPLILWTPSGYSFEVRIDPTLKPGEFRIERKR